MNVLHVVGARPNFMKSAPIIAALSYRGVTNVLVHTGQHYDPEMSDAFFDDLGLRDADVHLEVGSASHARQSAMVMERIEPVILERAPDLVVVVGDVNSTLAAALVCAKLLVPLAHVEAGLRSFDRTMPEEVNRVVTDQLSDLLFITSPEAEDNLVREGVAPERIRSVGNPMIDSLERHISRARSRSRVLDRFGLDGTQYGVMTLHRPSNVDSPDVLRGILEAVRDVAAELPILFPAHPRTVNELRANGLSKLVEIGATRAERGEVACVEPLGYIDFLRLMLDARVVLTDSGGIQEETTVLGVPCLTLRSNTERPITISQGTNRLVGSDPDAIRREALAVLAAPMPAPSRPPLWDGKAGERIADEIASWGAARR